MSFLQTDLPDMTGKVVAGRLLAEIVGTGGFGVVYRALDVQSASFQSAIKCIRKVKDPRSKESIRQVREMILHRAVSGHANIASIYEVFEDDEFLYVDMDYLPGGDLFSAIVDRMVFHHQDDLLKNVFIQILDAVQWCHNKGIAHRDIKPENVLCNEDYTQVYLADFGLSSKDGLSEEFGCGSSFYTSPGT
jgi:serine/threonine protein kinase